MPDLSTAEVIERVGELAALHSEARVDRGRIRAIMDGGAAGLRALLGSVIDNAPVDMPVLDAMDSGLGHLARKVGRMPITKVDPPPGANPTTKRGGRATERAALRQRIVAAYDEADLLEIQMMQIGRWLPGYGFCVWVIRQRMDQNGYFYPTAEIRDPYDCYPDDWGVGGRPADMAIIRQMNRERLIRMFPSTKDLFTNADGPRGPQGAVLLGGPSWEAHKGGDVTIAEYMNAEGTWIVLPEYDREISYVPNPLRDPPFVVAKRISFNRLQGAYDKLIGLQAALAKMMYLTLMAMQDAVNVETNIFGHMRSGTKYRKGRNAVNIFEAGAQVNKPTTNMPYQIFEQIDRVERHLRIQGNYSVTDDGNTPANMAATGIGLDTLSSTPGLDIEEYHKVLAVALRHRDALLLEWDDKVNGGQRKPLVGQLDKIPFAEVYDPAVAIGGQYRTRRFYGVMAGFDEPRKIITGINLIDADLLDRETLIENLDGMPPAVEVFERIWRDRAERIIDASLQARVAQQDPTANLVAVRLLREPGRWAEILTEFFTPDEPQPSPETAEFLAAGGAPGGVPDVLRRPADVSTVLGRLELGGGVEGGVQRVGRI